MKKNLFLAASIILVISASSKGRADGAPADPRSITVNSINSLKSYCNAVLKSDWGTCQSNQKQDDGYEFSNCTGLSENTRKFVFLRTASYPIVPEGTQMCSDGTETTTPPTHVVETTRLTTEFGTTIDLDDSKNEGVLTDKGGNKLVCPEVTFIDSHRPMPCRLGNATISRPSFQVLMDVVTGKALLTSVQAPPGFSSSQGDAPTFN